MPKQSPPFAGGRLLRSTRNDNFSFVAAALWAGMETDCRGRFFTVAAGRCAGWRPGPAAATNVVVAAGRCAGWRPGPAAVTGL